MQKSTYYARFRLRETLRGSKSRETESGLVVVVAANVCGGRGTSGNVKVFRDQTAVAGAQPWECTNATEQYTSDLYAA